MHGQVVDEEVADPERKMRVVDASVQARKLLGEACCESLSGLAAVPVPQQLQIRLQAQEGETSPERVVDQGYGPVRRVHGAEDADVFGHRKLLAARCQRD